MAKQIVSLFTNITKVDDEQRIVSGYASTDVIDCQGDIITTDAMKKAFPDYMKFANIREMHTDSAVGIVKSYSFDENGTFIEVEVVDDSAWNKVKKGVYKGFSIGGAVLKKIGNTVTDLMLVEISLVDRPANPLALITEYKSSDIESLPTELLTFAKKYDKDIPDVEEEDNSKDKKDDKKVKDDKSKTDDKTEKNKDDKEDDTKKSQLLIDIEKSGLSIEDIMSLINKSKEEKDAELVKKQEALIAKGFYSVQDVLSAINSLQWLLNDKEWDAKWENESNPEILLNIRDHILSLVDLAKQLMDNEVKDLTSASEEVSKVYTTIDTIQKSYKDVERVSLTIKTESSKDFKKSLNLKDEEISKLKEELENIKKNATFDNKSQVTTVSKKLNIKTDFEVKDVKDISKSIDEEISELNDKLSKCSINEEKELKNKLSSLKVRKSQLSVFN